MNIKNEAEQQGIQTTKRIHTTIGRVHRVKELITQLQGALDILNVDDARIEVEFDQYDECCSGFDIFDYVDKTDDELQEEIKQKKASLEKAEQRELEAYLKLKKKYEEKTAG